MDQKNLFLAIALSLAILFTWQFFVEEPKRQALEAEQQRQAEQAAPEGQATQAPGGVSQLPASGADSGKKSRGEAATASRRIPVQSENLGGSINLDNGRIDDVVLRQYRESVDPASANITLLSPAGAPDPYFAEFGWASADRTFGGSGTNWQAQGPILTPATPLVLTAQTDQGLSLTRTYSVDDKFMFTIVDRVENNGAAPVNLSSFARLTRINKPETTRLLILHEGPIGELDGTLRYPDYGDLEDEPPQSTATTGGWLGFTDKYWLAALVPDQTIPGNARFSYKKVDGDTDLYQTDFLERTAHTVQPGASVEVTTRLFAGAKVFDTLKEYQEGLGIPKFEDAIDFGKYMWPLARPMFFILTSIGNFLKDLGMQVHTGVAILLLTLFVKLLFFPLANKSYRSMSKMKALQPKMVELKEKYADDKQKLQQELMAMYKREKVNPVSGCLPIALQIPVFFALYKVLFISIEMRQSPFFGWVDDLSVRDPTNLFTLFGLVPWDLPSFLAAPPLAIGAWPLLMGLSMFLQQKLNPTPADPIQARMFMLMPLFFMFFLANFPVGLVIYWTWNNSLSIAQQYVIMRRMGVAVGGGKAKTA